MGFTLIMIPVSYLHGVLYIAPTIWPTDLSTNESSNHISYYCAVFLMTFLFANVMVNLFLTITVDTTCRRVPLPVVAQPGWLFCPRCKYYAPPRAYHCPTCQQCVLRRDHHCYFAGRCIGYYNHRYFIAFLVYLTISAFFGLSTSLVAVYHLAGGFSLTFIPACIFPVLAWVFQIMPVNPFVMLETSVALFVVVSGGGLLVLQVYVISRGQTYYEMQRNIRNYEKSRLQNVVDVLGQNWWFCWLFPFIPSPRPGDGAHYPPRDQPGQHAQGPRARGAPSAGPSPPPGSVRRNAQAVIGAEGVRAGPGPRREGGVGGEDQGFGPPSKRKTVKST